MIHIDTSALVDAITGPRRSEQTLRGLIEDGERIYMNALVLFEWGRGPRTADELADQEDLFPSNEAIPFGPVEASMAAALYKRVKRPRGREIDIAIAASAIVHGARFWTLNPLDFRDIPNLKML